MSYNTGPKIVTDGLVLCLDAADRNCYAGTGSTAYDQSGNGYDGTLANGPTFDYANGGGITFDGTNDYISVPYDLSWDDTNSVTIDICLRPPSTSQTRPIIGKGAGGLWEWQIIQWDTNDLRFVYWNTGGSHTNGPTTIHYDFFVPNEILYLTLVWNHSDNKIYFYRNGEYFSTVDWVDASINQDRTGGFMIGGNIYQWYSNSSYWIGTIYRTSVYSRPLSASEVLQNYNATKGRFGL